MFSKIKVAIGVLMLTSFIGHASAGVVDFNSFSNFFYSGEVADFRDAPQNIDGFTFSVSQDSDGAWAGVSGVFKADYDPYVNNGTNYMFDAGTVNVQRQSATPFSISGVDLAAISAESVTIIGYHTDGTSVSWSGNVTGNGYSDASPFSTFAVTGLTNLSSFQILSVGDSSLYVDNISFSNYIPPASAVPEPSAYAMLLGGLSLIGFVVRRRNMHV